MSDDAGVEEVERRIAVRLGWTNVGERYGLPPGGSQYVDRPRYARDHGEALRLLEHVAGLPDFIESNFRRKPGAGYRFANVFYRSQYAYIGTGDTLPEAFARACLAALDALAGEEGGTKP